MYRNKFVDEKGTERKSKKERDRKICKILKGKAMRMDDKS
jgi:hypothetical protein